MSGELIQPQLRLIVLECVKKNRDFNSQKPFHVSVIFRHVAEVGLARKLMYNAQLPAAHIEKDVATVRPQLSGAIWDVIWDLIVEGVIRPGRLFDGEHDLPFIHVTEYGKKAVDTPATPHDPEGYLKGLDGIPNLDPIIRAYAAESAETFRRHCFLSSTVMLGAASEKAFLEVVDAYTNALNPTDKSKFEKQVANKMIKKKHELFMKAYRGKLVPALNTAKLNSDWMETLDSGLEFVFRYFRKVRNDAGHPTGNVFDRETCLANLVILPSYLKVFYELIDWLKKNAV